MIVNKIQLFYQSYDMNDPNIESTGLLSLRIGRSLFGGIMSTTQQTLGNPEICSPTLENSPAQESACFDQK